MNGATVPSKRLFFRGVVALLSFGSVAALGCERPAPSERAPAPDRAEGTALEPGDGLQRAELREEDGIVDGDTFRVVGFDDDVRPLCVDAEEVLEGRHLREARADWEAYRRERTEAGERDFGTPMGNEATRWARDFFDRHGPTIWLEYPSPKQTRGYFGRHLAYVWVRRGGDGEWLNFNVELVRAGMSPYYTNFGRCPEYHDEFGAAQREARDHQRGIWDPDAESYDDYDERFERFDRRADAIEAFRRNFDSTPGAVQLGTDTAMSRLRYKLGEQVLVFGALDRVVAGAEPPRLELYHRHRRPLRVRLADETTPERLNVELREGEYLYVFGTVRLYRGDPVVQLDGGGFVAPGDRPPPIDR